MKSLQTLLTESASNNTNVYESLSYRISNWGELVDGLKEIGAPVKLAKSGNDKSLKIDGVSYRLPKDETDVRRSIDFDSKIVDALMNNSALAKMWKSSKSKFTTIIKNVQQLDTVVGRLRGPEHLDWGTTGAYSLLEYYSQITKVKSMMDDIFTKSNVEALRQYEVLRHLFDRNYLDMMTGQR